MPGDTMAICNKKQTVTLAKYAFPERREQVGSWCGSDKVPHPPPPPSVKEVQISGFWVLMGGNCPKQKWGKVSVSECPVGPQLPPPPTPQDVWKDQDKIKTCTAWCIFFWGIKHHWAGHGQNQNSDIQLFLFSVQKWSLLTVHAEPSPWAHWNNQFYTQFPLQYYWQMHCSHPFTALIILRCHSSSNISLALLSPRSNTLKHAESVRIGTHSLTHHI